jgi:hypothetical protein
VLALAPMWRFSQHADPASGARSWRVARAPALCN